MGARVRRRASWTLVNGGGTGAPSAEAVSSPRFREAAADTDCMEDLVHQTHRRGGRGVDAEETEAQGEEEAEDLGRRMERQRRGGRSRGGRHRPAVSVISSRTPLLTKEQEIVLAKRVEAGDEAAVQRLVHSNLSSGSPRGKALSQPQLRCSMHPGREVRADARCAEVRLASRLPASTYATWVEFDRRSQRAIADKARTIRLPVHIQDRVREMNNCWEALSVRGWAARHRGFRGRGGHEPEGGGPPAPAQRPSRTAVIHGPRVSGDGTGQVRRGPPQCNRGAIVAERVMKADIMSDLDTLSHIRRSSPWFWAGREETRATAHPTIR